MKMPKLKLFDRIEITWHDSVHQSGWRQFRAWKEDERTDGHGLEHKTIGYLMIQDGEAIIVCQSMNTSDKFLKTVDAIMTIPKACIRNIKRL